jgi:hypothetical protein
MFKISNLIELLVLQFGDFKDELTTVNTLQKMCHFVTWAEIFDKEKSLRFDRIVSLMKIAIKYKTKGINVRYLSEPFIN